MKKKVSGRKSGGIAGIEVVEGSTELSQAPEGLDPPTSEAEATSPKPKRKAKPELQANENFGVGDIRKAAAFANSIGGLDKAIALFQILKVAKEVQ